MINEDDLKRVCKEALNVKPVKNEKVVKFMHYCKGMGGPVLMETGKLSSICDHPECSSCRMIEEGIKNLAGYFGLQNICSTFEPREDYSSGICKNCGIKFNDHG